MRKKEIEKKGLGKNLKNKKVGRNFFLNSKFLGLVILILILVGAVFYFKNNFSKSPNETFYGEGMYEGIDGVQVGESEGGGFFDWLMDFFGGEKNVYNGDGGEKKVEGTPCDSSSETPCEEEVVRWSKIIGEDEDCYFEEEDTVRCNGEKNYECREVNGVFKWKETEQPCTTSCRQTVCNPCEEGENHYVREPSSGPSYTYIPHTNPEPNLDPTDGIPFYPPGLYQCCPEEQTIDWDSFECVDP